MIYPLRARNGHGSVGLHRGATLIELMVALTISLFLIGGIIVVYIAGRAATLESEQLSRVQENVRFVSDYLVRELRNAGFRDQPGLTFAQYNSFGDCADPSDSDCGFASISDTSTVNGELVGGKLTIRMSGTSSCAQPFSEFSSGIVKNQYFVERGSLWCVGSPDPLGVNPVELARGVGGVTFSFVGPEGGNYDDSHCKLSTFGAPFDDDKVVLENTCQGVKVRLVFTGTEGADRLEFPLELTASFRNVALGRLMYSAIPAP